MSLSQTNFRHVHFIGVCGTAMGSVAAAMRRRGYVVTGSDAGIYPPMSDFLRAEGLGLFEGYRPENIPLEADLVVVGNAMSRGNAEVEAVLERKLLYTSLPEVLKNFFLQGKRNLVVTGTHGKTTTASMLAWILRRSGRDPSYMIGGIPKDLGGGAYFGDGELTVLEGDEYDTAFFDKRSKFHHYLPEAVVINNIEFDHADIFANVDEIALSFRRMLRLVPRNGRVFYNGDDPRCREVARDAFSPVSAVGFGDDCDARITAVDYRPGMSEFTLGDERFAVAMDGEFNVRNAAMAASMALFAGVTAEETRAALADFGGVTRRQELRGERAGVRVIDDFGHHPSAIRLAVAAIRQRYPDARVWAVFEPRSNTTRRKVFQRELAEALARADGVLVAAIPNPEKFAPDDRLDPEQLMADIRAAGVPAHYEPDADAIVARMVPLTRPGDVVTVFSNGGFDGILDKLLAALAANAENAAQAEHAATGDPA